MNRKNTLFAALVFAGILSAGAVLAENQRPDRSWHNGPPGAAQQLAHLDQALELTDEQSLQLLEVLQIAEAERAALHARALESYQPEICALRQGTEADILAILTPEQAEAYQQIQQERAGRREGRRGPPAPDCPNQDG